jgi:hypothetical protein
MVIGKRDQGQKTGALDGGGELTLIAGTRAGNSGGNDLARLGDEVTQGINVFVIDLLNALSGETANALTLKQCRLGWAAGPFIFVTDFLPKSHFLLQFKIRQMKIDLFAVKPWRGKKPLYHHLPIQGDLL